jgi:hypothetical protein
MRAFPVHVAMHNLQFSYAGSALVRTAPQAYLLVIEANETSQALQSI